MYKRQVLDAAYFTPEEIGLIRETLEAAGISPLVYSRDGSHTDDEHVTYVPGKISRGMAYYLESRKGDKRLRTAMREALYGENTFYVTAIEDSRQVFEAAYEKLSADTRFTVLLQRDLYSDCYYFEIMPRSATKANAAERLAALYGCTGIVCFGDGDNDRSMFRIASACYAVGNEMCIRDRICAVLFVIGLIQKMDPLEMFMISISLAVAAIPEGLPAVVTIVLALGVRRMAAKRAIIRHLQAVETLGGCQVICSDKTGTLTQNKMTVVRCADGTGALAETAGQPLLQAAALCTTVELEGEKLIGEPTETAIAAAVPELNSLLKSRVKAAEIPFTSERKRMTVILRTENGYRVIAKGAPDLLLQGCTSAQVNGKVTAMTGDLRGRILQQNTEMAGEALRVLAVAEKTVDTLPASDEEAERGLCFLGLIGLEDPPRPEAKQAVLECRQAGIRPVMITGDQPTTASAIARRIGIDAAPVSYTHLSSRAPLSLNLYLLIHFPASKARGAYAPHRLPYWSRSPP